jgi:uncharacterized membrane protein
MVWWQLLMSWIPMLLFQLLWIFISTAVAAVAILGVLHLFGYEITLKKRS